MFEQTKHQVSGVAKRPVLSMIGLFLCLSIAFLVSGCILNSDDSGCECTEISYTRGEFGVPHTEEREIECTDELRELGQGSLFEYDGFGNISKEFTIDCN